jgi:hypothetical protein
MPGQVNILAQLDIALRQTQIIIKIEMEDEMTRAGQTISRKVSPDTVSRILALSKQGLHAGLISDRLGMNRRTVSSIISRNSDEPSKYVFRTGRKLNLEKAADIRRRAAAGESKRSLAAAFGVAVGTIEQVLHGATWRHAEAGCQLPEQGPGLPDETAVSDLLDEGFNPRLLELAAEICADA